METIYSPLRYYGSKSGRAAYLARVINEVGYRELREPFCGGASVSLYAMAHWPERKYAISDLHGALVAFWRTLRAKPSALIAEAESMSTRGKAAVNREVRARVQAGGGTLLRRGADYLYRNKTGFNGLMRWNGGHTGMSVNGDNMRAVSDIMRKAKVAVSNEDYREALARPGRDVAFFLDPPYLLRQDTYEGPRFKHEYLWPALAKCRHRWLMTLDDHADVRAAAEENGWHVLPFTMRYQCHWDGEGSELVITNDKALFDAAKKLDCEEKALAAQVANVLPDPWKLGEALWNWEEQTGGESDLRLRLLVASMDREMPSQSKVREARQTWAVFGKRGTRAPLSYSHHVAAIVGARKELAVEERVALADEDLLRVRASARTLLSQADANGWPVRRFVSHLGTSPDKIRAPLGTPIPKRLGSVMRGLDSLLKDASKSQRVRIHEAVQETLLSHPVQESPFSAKKPKVKTRRKHLVLLPLAG